MAKKKTTHEAQYVKNILKYGNPYGVIRKTIPILVTPVRKFTVAGPNPLAMPAVQNVPVPQDATGPIVNGISSNAYGGNPLSASYAPNSTIPNYGMGETGHSEMGNIEGDPVTGINNANKAIKIANMLEKTVPVTIPMVEPFKMAMRMSKANFGSQAANDVGNSGFADAMGGVANLGGLDMGALADALSGMTSDMGSMMGQVSGMFGELDGPNVGESGSDGTAGPPGGVAGGDPGGAGTPGPGAPF